MRYVEYSLQPESRNGCMVPVSSLPDIFAREDSGYTTHYQFSKEAAFAIKAQGNSQGLGRFPVYSDRLWIDIDGSDNTPEEAQRVTEYVRGITKQFIAQDLSFTVWSSGSKGYHLCIKIAPMEGVDVPYSQLRYVQDTLKILSDYSLYQAGRLLSNPGRLHRKSGKKKIKVFSYQGKQILNIPIVKSPEKSNVDLDLLTEPDLARIALSRLGSLILDAPLPGMRHTSYWGAASQCMEAGLKSDLVFGMLCWINKMSPNPKDESEVRRAVDQAAHQLGVG